MDHMKAFLLGEANRGKEQMVFDWDAAARKIRELDATSATAGLSSDMEYTSGEILEDGKAVTDSYTYLASTWATPVIKIDDFEYPCYKMQSEVPDWNSDTKWPDSALEILKNA